MIKMCEANAYVVKNNKEEILMESVDIVQPVSEKEWFLKNIFGEQMQIKGRIVSISLINHKILFEME